MDDTTGTTTADPWTDLPDGHFIQEEIAPLPFGSTADLVNAVAALDDAVEIILAKGEHTWSRISTGEREELYRRPERPRRKLTAAGAAMVISLRTDFAMPSGPRGPRWLARTFGLTLREAKTRVAAADAPVAELVRTAGPDAVADLRPFLTGIAGIDETYTDDDRARLRGVTIRRQRDDGMSPISGDLTPELASILQRLMADHANPRRPHRRRRCCRCPRAWHSPGSR